MEKTMTKQELQKIAQDVIRILKESVPGFFVNKDEEIPVDDLIFEHRAQMITDVEMYFYELMQNYDRESNN